MHHLTKGAGIGALVSFALFPTVAWAQGTAAPRDAIIVIGSRLARNPDDATAPVRLITADDLARSGQGDLADTLRREPAFAGGFGPGNTNMQTSGNGLNLLDLRGLGTARTLVLVNGRRMVSGQAGSSAVDITMIPFDRVERVEVLSGGASAVYGSDAVAGVVDIILRTPPPGITLTARSGISDRGDAPRRRIAMTAATGLAQGRGHAWLHATHERDGGLLSAARPQSASDYLGPSPFAPQGAFGLNGTIYDITGFTAAQGLVFGNDYDGATLRKGVTQRADGFDRNASRRIAVPVERLLLDGGVDLTLSPTITLRLSGQFGETRTRTRIEPYAAAGGDPARDGGSAIEVPGGLSLDNPFIPAPIAAEIAARNGDANPANDVAFIAFRRRLGDSFDRSNASVRRLWRGVAEVRGEWAGPGSRVWQWDAAYVFGRTTDHSGADTLLRDRLISALDAVRQGGAIVCRDPAARAAGCQPLDIFGANTASPAAIGWLRAGGGLQTVLDSRIDQHVLTATLSGVPFRLPAGDAHLVLGAEYRRESSVEDWDADTNAGRTLAARTDDVRGAFTVTSAFAELAVPILPRLTVEGALRLDRYSTIGTVLNGRAAARWTPWRGVHLRAAWSAASRAPSIAELYTSRRETFPGTLTLDPCAGVTASRANPLDADCRRIPQIQALVNGGGTLSYTTAEVQAINGFNGGNPLLQQETTDNLTAGITVQPDFARRLTFSMDYIRIRLSSAISTQPRGETVKACLMDAASFACAGLVQRLPNGKLTRVDAVLVNGGGIRHAAIDTGLDYTLPLGRIGALDMHGRWTHLLEHRRQSYAAAAFVDDLGQLQDALHARLGSGFRDRFVVDALYRRGAFSLGWTMRYFGPVVDTKDTASSPPASINRVPAIAYHDLQLRVALPGGGRGEAMVGVYNLFDRAPPLLPNGLAASGLLGVESAQEYDSIGRSLYVGMTLGF